MKEVFSRSLSFARTSARVALAALACVCLFAFSSPVSAAPPASAVSLQALLYPDIVEIVRVDTKRIDFDGIETFSDDFIKYAIGNLDIDDRYLVNLRKTQKETLQQRVRDYFEMLRAKYSKSLWPCGVSEYYILRYVQGQDFCNCVAVPLGLMPDAQQSALCQYLQKEYKPITVFERFGFLIAVIDHSSKVAAPGEKKKGDETEGDEEEEEEEESDGMSMGGGMSMGDGMSMGGGMDMGMGMGGAPGSSRMSAKQKKAQQKFLKERHNATMPAIKKRFRAASKKDGSQVVSALAATHGAAYTYVMKDTEAVLDMVTWMGLNGIELPKEQLETALNANKTRFKWLSFNISLVGSPRVILLAQLSDAKTANIFAVLLKGVLGEFEKTVNTKLDDQVKELELLKDHFTTNPFKPMLDVVFKAIHIESRPNSTQVALQLMGKELAEAANTFVPIFGGVAQEVVVKADDGEEDLFGDNAGDGKDKKNPGAKPAGDKPAGAKPDGAKPAAPKPAADAPAPKPAADTPAPKPADGKPAPKPATKKADDDPFA